MFRRWLVPDLAAVAAGITLLYCLLAWDGTRRLFRDADSGWHITTGELIVSSRSLPRTDPYSYTRRAQQWFAWEWGAEVAMALVHRMSGLAGVAWLYACAIAVGVWLWFRLHWVVQGNFWIACLMAVPMLSTANLHWLARPHVLGWVLALAALWKAEKGGEKFRWQDGAVIFLISALWANLHASFFLAPLIALIYAAAHWLSPLLWQQEASRERARARWFVWACAASALGTLANPYGWNLHRHIAGYLSNSELLARIGEFQSFNFHAPGAGQILAGVFLAALGLFATLSERRLAHFLLLSLLLVSALRVARGLPLLALMGLPLANGSITAALEKGAGNETLTAGLRRRLVAFLEYSRRLRAIDAACRGWVWALLAAVLALAWVCTPAVAARAGFPPEEFPVAASRYLEKLPRGIRLLHPDKYGGYLIYRFHGQRPVFFDGRSDFYGADFLKQYGRLMRVQPGWREQLERFGATHALLPRDAPLAEALASAGWKRLYSDEVAVLFERPPEAASGKELVGVFGVK